MSRDWANELNVLANLPEVIDNVAPGYRNVDLRAFFNLPDSFLFGDEHGMVILAQGPGRTYEMHYLFSYECRGRAALKVIRAGIRFVFTQTNADAIVGSTPMDNLSARRVNRALGGVAEGEGFDSSGRLCTTYRLTRARWAELSAGSSAGSGLI